MGIRMNKQGFLDLLRQALAGEVSADTVNENLNFYNEFIMTEMKKGREESEILQSLGDPRLIAKTIIEAQSTGADTSYHYEAPKQETVYEEGEKKMFRLPGWMMLILIFAAAFVVIGTIGSVFMSLLPVIIPVVLVVWLIRLFRR